MATSEPTESPRPRLVNPLPQPEDRVNQNIRPRLLNDLIGQERVKENLAILIAATRQRGEALDHVLFYGPPGLGKCITSDSLILTQNGWIPFEKMIPMNMPADSSTPIDLEVYGMHGLEPASHIYASGTTLTRRIHTRSGFVLEGTMNHPVLVATPNGPTWKPLSLLSTEDFVAIGRGMGVFGQTQSIVSWQSDSDIERRNYAESKVLHVYRELCTAINRFPTNRELVYAYAGEESRNPTPELTAKRLGLPLSDGRVYGTIAKPWNLISSPPNRIERAIILDSDLAYFLGVLVGDGHFEKTVSYPAFIITCGEVEMQTQLRQIIKRHFGRAPEVRKYRGKTAQIRFPQSFGRVMLAFGVKAVNARQKEVPASVLAGSRQIVVGFLQGLFDADGNAWKEGYVEFSSRSEKLSQQVQLLLSNLGIIAHRTIKHIRGEPHWNLFIGGQENAAAFFQKVGFRLHRKLERGANQRTEQKGWSRSELVPYTNSLLATLFDQSRPHSHDVHKLFDHVIRNDRTPTRRQINRYLSFLPNSVGNITEFQTLAALSNPNIYWDQVTDLTESSAKTYDFVVPGSHSFQANGFINHNTTLAHVLANEMGVNIKITSGPAIERAGDLAAILTNLRANDVLFIDEVHRLGRVVEEVLYPAMEDFALDIIIGKGPSARSIRLRLPQFTVIGATTRLALLTAPLRARFGSTYHLDFYDVEAMRKIVQRAAGVLGVTIDPEGVDEIAQRGRGTPRVALRLLRRVRDYAQVRADGAITRAVAQQALDLLNVDPLGLDEMDRRVLRTIIEKYRGGPVGLSTIAASISEEPDTIMDVVEPYLLQLGFLERTSQGRTATRLAYEHLGLEYDETQLRLL
jgi:Holliday junction DNA helicase RuvB